MACQISQLDEVEVLRTAIVVFAKTPGYSQYKTRLASSIGSEATKEFYLKSILATKSFIEIAQQKVPKLELIIAVAEAEAMNDPFWEDYNIIDQGQGSLGERQSSVYNKLLKEFSAVFFLGTDSPHLNGGELAQEIDSFLASTNQFLLGPASDGGYYIFGGKSAIGNETWKSVTYSSKSTFNELKSVLQKLGSIQLLKESFDVDDFESLKLLASVNKKGLTMVQKDVISLMEKVCYRTEIS